MLIRALRVFSALNTRVLLVARFSASLALGLMVMVILLQVFFRYVLNNALSWPDELSRFLMLWMACLMAPSAFRWGGFVAIDMFIRNLPLFMGRLLALMLLLMSGTVLWVGVKHGYDHTLGFAGTFTSSSLRLPLDLIGMELIKVKLKYMYASLFIGTGLMLAINIELLLRCIVQIIYGDVEQPSINRPAIYVLGPE